MEYIGRARAAAWFVGIVLVSIEFGVPIVTAGDQSTSVAGVSEEEYEIYSAAVTEQYVRADTKLLMIVDRTFRYAFDIESDEPWRVKRKGVNIDQSAGDDYEAKNNRPSLLNKASFKLPVKHNLITDLDLKAIFHGHWGELEWIDYYRRYPDSKGFIMLSRVGFNTEHTQALLYLGSRCGPGCSEIHFLLLEKANGKWTTKRELRK